MSDNGNIVSIRHLVIEGSSRWLLGHNITRTFSALFLSDNVLQLPDFDTISLVDHDFHSCIPFNSFVDGNYSMSRIQSNRIFCATAQLTDTEASIAKPFSEMKKIVYKVTNTSVNTLHIEV